MRTAIYARISRDPEEQREGVDRQIERGTKIAGERGWQVVDTFADNDLSGFKTTRRPGFEALRDRILTDGIEAVLVQHQDRLARNVSAFRNFADLCRDHDVRLETWSGPIEINSATGRFTSTVQSAVDEHYSALISEKVRAVVDERARTGEPNGGRRAFGYLAGDPTIGRAHNLAIDPAEAAIVRELYDRVLAGESIRAIRIDLNERDIPTTAGNPFTNRAVRDLLMNPRYIGMRTHRGNVIGTATWEPIIDRTTWERAQAVLSDPRRRTNTAGPRTYYLSGLAYCGTCGHRLVARPQWRPNVNVRSYGCPARAEGGCGGSRIIAEPLEGFIRDVILETLTDPRLARRVAEQADLGDVGRLVTEITTLEERQSEAATIFADGQITGRQLAAVTETLTTALTALRAELADLEITEPGLILDPAEIGALWEGESAEWRNQVAAVVIDRITIAPAVRGLNYFDPRRVTITRIRRGT
jgi:DNA invertase Pin-like site-specific DNA recombinase